LTHYINFLEDSVLASKGAEEFWGGAPLCKPLSTFYKCYNP